MRINFMFLAVLTLLLVRDAPPVSPLAIDRCPECRADLKWIRAETRALHSSTRPKDRVEGAVALASVRWRCHPEVVAALAEALGTDKKAQVRAGAAEALGRMVPDLAVSHLGLLEASRSDPEASVRKQARKALAAKGLRCVADCPICGPIPSGAAITGPSVLLPEWDDKPAKTGTKPKEPRPTPSTPPALPDATP